ncbi:hypothetical protein [Kitasatospora sp. MBT63]|uniref:hypothetical protein n=1 Tax=Kitasatospora sp. MBT63 TaxID=1444768 RepID=UPI00053A43CA|nr:hypothetical protein [Kitasatospora sp. MBT63]
MQQATLNRPIPGHHHRALADLLISHPYSTTPRDRAERLVNSATITAWALRPAELNTLTLTQYTDLVMHACYPLALKHALLHRGERRHLRTVADEITRHINRHYS